MNPQDPASVLAWGLVECLLVYPQFVSDKAYYEKNTYTDSFQKFLLALSEGKRSPAEAWDAAFTKTARDSLDSDFLVFLRKASQP